jgi:hypothetical protein
LDENASLRHEESKQWKMKMARPKMKRCIKCNKYYRYITENQCAKNSDKYELNQIGFSLAYCAYCQRDLNKEKNYSMLMKRLGDSNDERRRNFKRIHLFRKIQWMTFRNLLPNDLCLYCGVRTEKGAYRQSGEGVNFVFCSKECKDGCEKLPLMEIFIGKGNEDFTCISENNSEYMYRQYDQLYRQQEKKIQDSENEKERQMNIEFKKTYFERMQLYKDLWDKDKKYGSIDLMIKGL